MATDIPWVSELEEYIGDVMEKNQVPGLAVAVLRDNEVVYARGFGFRDRTRRLPVNEETIFGVASVTKSFTAAAIMKLAEEGRLLVSDPVAKYLPEFRVPGEGKQPEITIRQFLAHLSAIPPQPFFDYAMAYSTRGYPKYDPDDEEEDEAPPSHIETYEELMEHLATGYELLGKPGEWLSYSNDAYALLGAIVERVSGQSYESFVTEHILEPCGMSRTTFSLDELVTTDNVTRPYMKNIDGEVLDVPRYQEAANFVGAAFLRSCAVDLARYGRLYLGRGLVDGKRLLEEDSILKMETPVYPLTPNTYYAYALQVTPGYHGRTLVEHGGALTGVASRFGYVPEEGLACAVLTNMGGAPSEPVWLSTVNLALGLPRDTRRIEYGDYELPVSELKRFVGIYRGGEGQEVTIEVEDGRLWAEDIAERLALRPVGPDTFVARSGEVESCLKFYPGGEGVAARLFRGTRVLSRDESD